MTDHDFELRLRADLRQLVGEPASAALRARVVAIPEEVPTSRGRRLLPEWRSPALLRFAPLALAAAAALVIVLVGSGLLIRPPDVGPPGPVSPTPEASATASEVVHGWPDTNENPAGLYSWGEGCAGQSCTNGFMHNGYGSGDVEIRIEGGYGGDIFAVDGTAVTVAGHDGIYRPLGATREQWLVEVEGTTISIVLSAEPGTSQSDLAEAHAIIDSMRTEPRDNPRGFSLVFRLATDDWDSG